MHECKICQKSFIEAGSLKKHKLLVHAGEKPHKCLTCGKCFKYSYAIKRHKQYNCNKDAVFRYNLDSAKI